MCFNFAMMKKFPSASSVILTLLMLLILLLFRAFLIGYRIDLIRVEATEIFEYRCFPAIFSFGDDWADTGNAQALYPAHLEAENLPYGITYFDKPAHRLSDGRLLIDFFAQAFGMPFLNSYAMGINVPNLHHGINFAVAGTTATSMTLQVPYPLSLQLDWLHKFRSDVMEAMNKPSEKVLQPLPESDYFHTGLYIISSGLNDYRHVFVGQNLTVAQAVELVPSIVSQISSTIQALLNAGGAEYVMVLNLQPLGCSPEFLTLFSSSDSNDYDAAGCLKLYNTVAQLHNQILNTTLNDIRSSFNNNNTTEARRIIAYVDYYQMMMDVIKDPHAHGFKQVLQACCGFNGSTYNYNTTVLCGKNASNGDNRNISASVCDDPSSYMSWDGIHTTEAFHSFAASNILAGNYTLPADERYSLFTSCPLNFSMQLQCPEEGTSSSFGCI